MPPASARSTASATRPPMCSGPWMLALTNTRGAPGVVDGTRAPRIGRPPTLVPSVTSAPPACAHSSSSSRSRSSSPG
ncbi:MAG: hypothetical protein A2138_24440 [Deltaproteobacteria bacterium RBG_16_71_12]|nr:MAG: hypothetical protein A2138_24440 [Deltaproteobacteria bacterium RBG_16_71_12]